MPRRNASAIALLLVLGSIISVQVGASVAKGLFALAPPLAVAWLRLVLGAVVLGLVARPRLTGRTRWDWATVLAYGASMTAMNAVFYIAIQRIPLGMAVTFEFLGPLLLSLATNRRPSGLVWVGLAGLGVALLGFQPCRPDPVGVALALLAGALWAAYIALAGPTGRRWEGVSGVTVATWFGAVTLAPFALVTMGTQWRPGLHLIGLGLLVALMSSVIPYAFEMRARRTMGPAVFGILMSLEPAAAAIAALFILGEPIRPLDTVAMACVVVASVGAVRSSRTAPTTRD